MKWKTFKLKKPPNLSKSFLHSHFKARISSSPNSLFPPEKSRYHLYLNLADSYSNIAFILLALKGLNNIISASNTSPILAYIDYKDKEGKFKKGWVFDKHY